MSDFVGNPLLAERARLVIMAALASSDVPLDFVSLLEITTLTKGNLSTHARKLEEAGYIAVSKEFIGRKPITRYQCSSLGKSEMKKYLSEIEMMLKKL